MPSREAALHAFAAALSASFPTIDLGQRKVAAAFDVLEALVRRSVGSPLPRRELIQLLESETGETLIAPKGIPHTYRVESADGAHWLLVTHGEDFERFVRAFSRPAERDGLPDHAGPPTPEQAEALARACAEYGIEIVGPPLG